MNSDRQSTISPAFLPGSRASGVLLHVTSLPSPYGIGDMGPVAREWIDRLQESGQSWWQVLPLGALGSGNCPYQPLSSFAGNWLLISPDDLIADGLLRTNDVAGRSFPEARVDFESVMAFKNPLLETVWQNFDARAGQEIRRAYEQFCEEQKPWLDDFALFRSLQQKYRSASYLDWPTDLVRRNPLAIAESRRELAIPIERVRLAQFLVFRQGRRLKDYAHAKGVRLIGDLPYFVSPDSSDVWANPELFLLDEHLRPRFVAGVPPDYFSSDGQLWGNPVYDWNAMRATGFRWCLDRVRALTDHVDLIRLDHFRGFAAAWHVPAASQTAKSGTWVPGPGEDFFNAVQKDLGTLPFIAEDLGDITPDVDALRNKFQLAGTRVLQFAFNDRPDNPHLPHNYVPNTVVYTGTHDNNTTRGWYDELSKQQRKIVLNCLQRSRLQSTEAAATLMSLAWSSVASLAMIPLQDVLSLDVEARMNVPGTVEGNWDWRCSAEMLSAAAFQSLQKLTTTYNRQPAKTME